jgi:predicted glycosyltransferase
MHHLMAHCAGFFGESATMASECAVLGVPAVYAANSPRGYTEEQETRYGLVRNVHELTAPALEQALDWLLGQTLDAAGRNRETLLAECVDVAGFVAETVRSAARAGR